MHIELEQDKLRALGVSTQTLSRCYIRRSPVQRQLSFILVTERLILSCGLRHLTVQANINSGTANDATQTAYNSLQEIN